MKNIKYIMISLLVILIVLAGCNSKLDINPQLSVDATASLKTSNDVKSTLIGAYSNLESQNLYGGGFMVYPDLLASYKDINFFGTFQGLTQISNKAIPINNDFVASSWIDAYRVINITNEVLGALSLVDSVDRAVVEGEAKFIRGCMYFELVKLYSKAWNDGDPTVNPGVPLVLTPTHTTSDALTHPKRNTVAEVYTQVISDLSSAESKLPTPPNVTYFFATTGAAAAMLSRVYLSQLDFANARDAANRVISSGVYKLVPNFADEFPYLGRGVRIYNTVEDIFAAQVSEQSGFNGLNQYYAASNKGGRGDIEMDTSYLKLYEAGDDRFNLFYDDNGSIRTGKFDNLYGNIKVVRLAEMYLTRAEANFQLGTTTGDTPLNDVNTIRARAKLTPLGSLTLNQIWLERYIELSFEGQWLVDYKRTGRPVGTILFNDPSLVFPIPQRETIVNPNLVQNAGY